MNRRDTLILMAIAMGATPAHNLFAADDYVDGQIYNGGDTACHAGDLYRAKWWAGPSDHPGDVDLVAQAWETPWERIEPGSGECGGASSGNQAPSVSAAATPAPIDPSGYTPVELFASADDPDGDALSFAWSQVATGAPSVQISDEHSATASVLLPEATQPVSYIFRVSVSDAELTAVAEVEVSIEGVGGNSAPVAAAAATPTQLIGAGTIGLDASASIDPDGDALTYQWRQTSPAAPLAELSDSTSATPSATLPEVATDTDYVFEVQVSDGQSSATAQVSVSQSVEQHQVACPLWTSGATYVEGDKVAHAGSTWRAGWWTQGDEPGTTGEWGVWRLIDAGCSNDGSSGGGDGGETGGGAGEGETGGGSPTVIALSELEAREAELTSGELMSAVRASIATRENSVVEAISADDPANPANVLRVESILSETDWNHLFPRRAPEYSYENFLKAIGKFPAFCGDYDDGRDADAICRKALATMFAHFTQETGGHTIAWEEPQWRQGLVYLRELGWSEDMPGGYGICDPSTWQGATWPCATFEAGHPSAGQFKSYFGRGAKQLSYNYNYGPFSQAMFGDVTTLLEQPNLVADTWLNLASAVFFYVYPQPPKPSMLHALDGTWAPNAHDLASGLEPGFGVTTQIINGGIECGGSAEHAQSQNRIDYYLNFADYLGVPVPADEVLGCANMQRFDTQGAGALAIYWEQDWSTPNACKLVNYQTAFSAFSEGDYAACVVHYFDVEIDAEG